ncbi:perilipin-3-like isoform X2 [Nothoprocta perdicaria]|uniref:perilipin-3-like isoform X2 n=1 Tax=Nothoprocta perdicaria TaxID=30464 RepID=UPI000E1BD832|nr:perilipin-3-like isoform X2 [Nothoprocta perdicaria]
MERAEDTVKGNEEEASQSRGNSSMDITPESSVTQQAIASFHTYLVESEDLDDVFLPSAEFTRSLDVFETASEEQQKWRRHQESVRYVEFLPVKFYQRIRHHSMLKMKQVGQSMKELFSQVQEAIDLIDWYKESGEANLQNGQEKQKQLWLEWSKRQPGGNEHLESAQPEQTETCALAAVCHIIQFLKDIHHDLMPGLPSVPDDIQEQVHEIKTHIEDIHTSFSGATSFQELSRNVLSQSREKAAKAKECLDVLLEYLTQNIPLIKHLTTFLPSESFLEEEEEG